MTAEGGGVQTSMKTVSTLCASGAGIGLAPVGLAVIREEASHLPHPSSSSSTKPTTPNAAMTAVASSSPFYYSRPVTLGVAATTPPSARSISDGLEEKTRSGRAKLGQKRTLTPSASFRIPPERNGDAEEGVVGAGISRTGTPTSQSTSWLRRLSSSMSASRDSAHTPVSRPGSAAISHTTGSVAFSHSGSTTPIFPDTTTSSSSPLPPNKLVKRSSSIRSTNGSLFSTPSSRLPLPVLRRPATSHQRTAALQQTYAESEQSDRMSVDEADHRPRDTAPRHYFTPRSAPADLASHRGRVSSSIPTPSYPIKLVYPDRRYTPVLVSANHPIQRAPLGIDEGEHAARGEVDVDGVVPSYLTASSPLPSAPTFTGSDDLTPRRSFSIGGLLPAGSQQLWKRPSNRRLKHSGSKLIRRRDRVVSAPQESMGNTFSASGDGDQERPVKRRDLTNPRLTPRSIYSSSSSNAAVDANPGRNGDMDVILADGISERFGTAHPLNTDVGATQQQTLALGQRTLPSATSLSGMTRPNRASAAHSEANSFVDSDSEYRSLGDASTDYQSDTAYNSYNTRTTRSSSGRRGPHIGDIFEDSPPVFSSGRSTKLKDYLNDASYPAADTSTQYRPSTIEEEGSIMSTPVRSLRTNSVMSTPSARPGAGQAFTSSPPEMQPGQGHDEIDWDVSDDDEFGALPAAQQTNPQLLSIRKALASRLIPELASSNAILAGSTTIGMDGVHVERANLYQWSDMQHSPSRDESPSRPKTVHGKKDGDSRGSRAIGRRQASGVHARSHSVPVAPDTGARRTNVVANRFGTWNVGSKMVTEDWNDDFAFDEVAENVSEQGQRQDDRDDNGRRVFVPRSIREQQDNVVANISLLREWGLLIEELKELRIRAATLDMLSGPHARDWAEVDAMIDLADQETEEQTLDPRRSPPSSPSFDYGAFDEPTTLAQARGRTPQSTDSVRTNEQAPPSTAPERSQTDGTRPRKDSEAVALYVIEALQSRRSVSDAGGAPTAAASQPRKVPFDTQTLRHIVPYVKTLKRKVKEALREKEDLQTSPKRPSESDTRFHRDGEGNEDEDDEDDDESQRDDDEEHMDDAPPFDSPFARSDELARRRLRRSQAATDHDGGESSWTEQDEELAERVQQMMR